jgi:hypothetical protein
MNREPSLPPLPLLEKPITIRLTAVYKTARALLRELSRAVNRGATRLRSESGLPVGTRFTLGLVTDALKTPIEVAGVVTASAPKGRHFEMRLRYDFDPVHSRRLLDSVLALVGREEPARRPRREGRLPLALSVAGGGMRGVRTSVEDLSRRGCRIQLLGARLPLLRPGDRLRMTLAGSSRGERRAVLLDVEVRWARAARGRPGKRLLVGAAFIGLSAKARARLHSILKLRDLRPTIHLTRSGKRRSRRLPA